MRNFKKIIYDHRPAVLDELFTRKALRRKNIRINGARGHGRFHVEEFHVLSDLPPLAWFVKLQEGKLHVYLGRGVEKFEDGFFEGVWAGPYDRSATLSRSIRFGTGALIRRGWVDILPMSNPYEPIFLAEDREEKSWIVSNTLSLTIAAVRKFSKTDIFPYLTNVVQDNHTATERGVLKYDPVVYDEGRFRILRVLTDTVSLYPDGSIKFTGSPKAYNFKSFDQYRSLLSRTVGDAITNGRAVGRRKKMAPITSITKGYDSPAASVLAYENGCEDGVAIDVVVYGIQDSGKELADQFGLNVEEFPHIAGKELETLLFDYSGDLEEAAVEFVATVGHGDDLTFKSFEAALEGTVFFSGALGDSVWDRTATIFPGMPIRTLFGKSLNEFRLRVGFAHIPVPTIGAMYPRSIIRISNSPEMEAYSVGGSYDRPIPRRIAEDAGISRDSFGNIKRATAPDSQNRQHLWPTAMRTMIEKYQAALG